MGKTARMRRLKYVAKKWKVVDFLTKLSWLSFGLAFCSAIIIIGTVAMIALFCSRVIDMTTIRIGGTIFRTSLKTGLIACVVMVVSNLLAGHLKRKYRWPKALSQATRSDHGNDLATVMDAIRHESLEYWAMFDEEGRKLTEGTLLSPIACSVVQKDWQRVWRSVRVDVHNHPGADETSFSAADFYSTVCQMSQYSVVVTPSYNYILENPYWNTLDYEQREELAEEVKAYADKLHHSVLLCIFPRQYSQYVSRQVAKKYSLVYRVENLRLQRFQNWLRRFAAVPRVAACVNFSPESCGESSSIDGFSALRMAKCKADCIRD